jgi:hypothetical protein
MLRPFGAWLCVLVLAISAGVALAYVSDDAPCSDFDRESSAWYDCMERPPFHPREGL